MQQNKAINKPSYVRTTRFLRHPYAVTSLSPCVSCLSYPTCAEKIKSGAIKGKFCLTSKYNNTELIFKLRKRSMLRDSKTKKERSKSK